MVDLPTPPAVQCTYAAIDAATALRLGAAPDGERWMAEVSCPSTLTGSRVNHYESRIRFSEGICSFYKRYPAPSLWPSTFQYAAKAVSGICPNRNRREYVALNEVSLSDFREMYSLGYREKFPKELGRSNALIVSSMYKLKGAGPIPKYVVNFDADGFSDLRYRVYVSKYPFGYFSVGKIQRVYR